jgi:hypothetical protein
MEFRWVAGITIWAMLAGPAFVGLSQWRAPAPATALTAPPATELVTHQPPAKRTRP